MFFEERKKGGIKKEAQITRLQKSVFILFFQIQYTKEVPQG